VGRRRLRWVVLAAVAAVAAGLWFFHAGAEVEVAVPEKATAADVARILKQNNVMSSPRSFRILAKVLRLDRKLKPGVYRMREGMSSLAAVYRLYRGANEFVHVTVPEGWRLEQIAERLDGLGVTSGSDFLAYAKSRHWEGFLFPTTYFLTKDMPPEAVARLMREEFDRQVLPVYKASGRSLDLDKVVTLASIIERETTIDKERPIVASVYYNRFARSKRLEADPTVQYALGHWKKGLTLKDLQIPSPYNTYLHSGMPPAPICSPGLPSIKATLYPERTDYLYFMADYKGGNTFQKTYEEFLQAKAQAKKELRHQKQELTKKRNN
jgi:UPF0755 protein